MGAPKRFLIVGGGKMGEAILSGWIAASAGPAATIAADDIEVVDPGAERRAYLEQSHGVACVSDVSQVERPFDVAVLAVKPQVMGGVLESIASLDAFSGGASGPLFITIAAGLPTSSFESVLEEGTPVVRVMPNMPLAIGAGASGVCAGAHADDAQVAFVAELFGCLGKAVVVDEQDMDTVCALSGSGPAYVAALIEMMRDAAAEQGLDPALAEKLALQTVLGTARLIDETGVSPAEARKSICSPGGTTLAALDAMEAHGFEGAVHAAIDAAVKRSKELAQC